MTILLYILAGISVSSLADRPEPARPRLAAPLPRALRALPPPVPEPLDFRAIAPADAVAINAAVPISKSPNPAARAFVFKAASDADRTRALECLTAAVYYEAAVEPTEGQRAVAQVVLNRVRHPAFPDSVCGVVFQGSDRPTGCQFTFTCDGALARIPSETGWKRAQAVAEDALAGKVYGPVGYSTHYHTNWVVPYWSGTLTKDAIVGSHIFYRWAGGWGRPGAFVQRAAGTEPEIALMRRLTADPSTLAEAGPAPPGAEALPVGSIDSFQRAVLNRYEPATREGVAGVVAEQAREGQAISPTYRWAMTGDSAGPAQAPLGKPAAAPKACPDAPKKPTSATPDPAKATTC